MAEIMAVLSLRLFSFRNRSSDVFAISDGVPLGHLSGFSAANVDDGGFRHADFRRSAARELRKAAASTGGRVGRARHHRVSHSRA